MKPLILVKRIREGSKGDTEYALEGTNFAVCSQLEAALGIGMQGIGTRLEIDIQGVYKIPDACKVRLA